VYAKKTGARQKNLPSIMKKKGKPKLGGGGRGRRGTGGQGGKRKQQNVHGGPPSSGVVENKRGQKPGDHTERGGDNRGEGGVKRGDFWVACVGGGGVCGGSCAYAVGRNPKNPKRGSIR